METKNDNTREATSRKSQEVTEIQIKSYEDSTFFKGFLENGIIGEPMQLLLPEMNSVVSSLAQGFQGAGRDPHIAQESHILFSGKG